MSCLLFLVTLTLQILNVMYTHTLLIHTLTHSLLIHARTHACTLYLYSSACFLSVVESKRSPGTAAVWVARNKFAVLDKNHQVSPHKGSDTG